MLLSFFVFIIKETFSFYLFLHACSILVVSPVTNDIGHYPVVRDPAAK